MASSGTFAVLNSLIKSSTNSFSFSNCRITSSSGGWGAPLTLAASTGKWYVEINFVVSDTNGGRISVLPTNSAKYNDGDNSVAGTGDYAVEWKYDGDSNFIANNNSSTQASVGSWAQGDVAAVAINLDASPKTVQFYKNNSTIGTAENINTSATGDFTVMIYAHNAGTWHINAGQDSSFGGNETAGGNADGNGFGDFYYSPPSGFNALCSANLPVASNVDPARTDDDHLQKQFGVLTWTGDGTTGRAITGLGFQPDFIWFKDRAQAFSNRLYDTSRGISGTGGKRLASNAPNAENDQTSGQDISAVGTDGFTLGATDANYTNYNTDGNVAWCWRADGGTTATNTSGTITSTVQANQAAGFSIITYTGTGTNGTIGHGLSVAPDFLLFKRRSGTSQNWKVYHSGGGVTKILTLNDNRAGESDSTMFQDTDPTNSVISIGTQSNVNTSTSDHLCYAWHNVEGYSKFGVYEGNNNNDGTFVFTGFRPRLIFLKAIDQAGEWVVYDTARNVDNPVDSVLNWDSTTAESANDSTRAIDVLSNGFKLRTSNITINNTNTFVYGAWGDVSFKYNNTHPS